MNRRKFIYSASVGAVLPGSSPRLLAQSSSGRKRALMKLGCQSGPTSEKRLQFFSRHGIKNICGIPEFSDKKLGYPTVDELLQLKERAARWNISIDLLTPPFLASSHIDQTERPAIMLGRSPERDRDIECFQNLIRNCARAEIPAIKYNMSILGVVRTPGRTPGRGDATYSTWKHKEAKPSTPLTKAGVVNADAYWERITYFLERVIPVATEYKVRMACHPHDPGMPPEGYQGVDTVLGTVNGLKKFITIKESPYHGLNFCQGTVSENLVNPKEEIFDVIRYFGTRQKIFNVHFRNIRGHRNDFIEVFPDEGDIDFVKAIQVYREVGYPYLLMPDHVPNAPGDQGGLQSFAFAYGYIRGLMQSLEHQT